MCHIDVHMCTLHVHLHTLCVHLHTLHVQTHVPRRCARQVCLSARSALQAHMQPCRAAAW